MKTDYCTYPPEISDDVEITEQRDGERRAFIAGSAATGRFILLRETEFKVYSLFGRGLTTAAMCDEFKRQHGGTLSLGTLIKFMARLDQVGILAGERSHGRELPEQQFSQGIYVRFKLFNPEALFEWMVPALRWVWTTGFVVATLLLMLATLLWSLIHWAEMTNYGDFVLREHFMAVFIAGWVVVVLHEFAHGLTCKAFGGRVNEVGVLMIFYFLPGLYCNVSGIHLIPQRNRRLWVIAAGIYWQLLVGTFALLGWFALAPHTLPADLAFIFFFGSVLNIVFNANPLIKLDGYYFLSQWLRLPNLMDRSRAYWRASGRRMFFGERDADATRWSRRERAIYAAFGLLSYLYTVALALLILRYIGGYLVDSLYLLGLLLTAGIALLFARRPLQHLTAAAASKIRALPVRLQSLLSSKSGGKMENQDQTTTANPSKQTRSEAQRPRWRRRLVPLTMTLLVVVFLALPWSASVGNYGTLIAIPGKEAIIRAPESATLIALNNQPGQQVASGTVIGRMGDFELEEQIVQVQSELARANADHDRLLGELRAREEAATRADLQLRQRRHDYDEIDAERRQIELRRIAESSRWRVQFASVTKAKPASSRQPEQSAVLYPAALAVLQAEVDSCRAQFEEAGAQRDRARKLNVDGIMPRSELDAAETRAATLASALAAARQRLEAALVEHRRKYANTTTEMNVARSDLSAERLQIAKLSGELDAMRVLIGTLEARRDLLERKRAQFELVTLRSGTVFGEELPRAVGQYFQRGAEICRVADTNQLLLRIQVPEREIGDVRAGHPVRLKVRAYPDRVFRGVVSKIGGESEQDQYDQATYRVELTIENNDGLLRPGMTAFARIDFDRKIIASILLHKTKQALRPELWML
ncbi:MAG: HlyD family efflux transporter periplasmic adaptor subunit [Acidobacteria bacterium]|nr:HlyD family efflux transporter periplasmic adaptor subunit [Acidobacteriota bacterium]